ncbi:cyclic GMP-AMP synthase-like receptor 1 [Oculina patagonica]
MQRLKNDYLQSLYKEAEFDREHEEVKEIEERITSLVHEISEYIGRKDPLFKNFVIPSGSYFEDLKVEGPDEFDFMICLENLSLPGVCVKKDIPLRPVPDPGYVHVQVSNETLRQVYRKQRYISNQGNLKPDVLLKRFKELIEEALRKRKRRSHEKLAERVEVELRKIPITIKVRWNGEIYTNYEISIDLTLCIKLSGWPAASDIRGRLNRGHPGYEVFKEAVRAGHHLVASTIGESGKPRPCWRLSFSVAEGIVLKGICKNPRLMHKVALKVLKVLRKKNEHDLCLYEDADAGVSYRIQWVFHSYVLKTMFLHEWCEFPEDSYWSKDKLGERVRGILERIRNSLKDKDIRSFWVPDYKLFNFRARKATQTKLCEEKLSNLLRNLKLEPQTSRC